MKFSKQITSLITMATAFKTLTIYASEIHIKDFEQKFLAECTTMDIDNLYDCFG